MQEQNFERQVKETMEGFSIPPSAPVWQKIEKEIRQKKERRRLVFWFLPILLAGGIWLAMDNYFTAGEDRQANITGTQQPAIEKNGQGEINPSKGPTAPLDRQESETDDQIPATKNSTQQNTTSNDNSDQYHSVNTLQPAALISAAKNTVKKKKSYTGSGDNKTPVTPKSAVPNKVNTATPAVTHRNADTAVTAVKEPEATATISSADTKLEEQQVVNMTSTPDTPAVNTVAPGIEPTERPRKWKIALQATGGYAQTMTSFFPLSAAPENTIMPNSIGYTPRVRPYEPLPGAAFSFGVSFSTTASTRFQFATGLQYSFAGSHQPHGEMVDASWTGVTAADSGGIYRSGNEFTYNNKYHFAEIPAGIDVKVFSTLPVNLHTGLSLSALVSSNALHFDEANGLYYRRKNNLQKLGVNAYAGFSFGIAKERLKIGPHLQYSLLPLHKNEDKKYLLTGGVRARWSLN